MGNQTRRCRELFHTTNYFLVTTRFWHLCLGWKDSQQREVDFVIKEDRQVTQLIQVCQDMSRPETRRREIRALLKAAEALSCDQLIVLTADTENEEEVEWYGHKRKVRLLPLRRWLQALPQTKVPPMSLA